ncbi:MAG: hypothetical protein WAK94_09085 [Steroidobacteraceae bacterium]
MSNGSSRGLLIAVLVVAVANLLVAGLAIAILLRQPPHSAAASAPQAAALPAEYTDAVLAQTAERVTGPYDRGDVDGLYDALDDYAKNQVTRDKVAQTVAQLKQLVGSVDSAAYAGFQELPSEGGAQLYQLNYDVKLSGGKMSSGSMQINVLDRGGRPGIVGFFIYGRTQ